jgi:hypothetical protein
MEARRFKPVESGATPCQVRLWVGPAYGSRLGLDSAASELELFTNFHNTML